MNLKQLLYISVLLVVGCKNGTKSEASVRRDNNVAIANQFIDAFYSFNRDTLKGTLANAKESQPDILYYQKWAECGNYEILKRFDCEETNDSTVICPITVKDDLMGALQIDLNVTDTFHITIKNQQIRSVQTSSNDPDLYYKAREWMNQNRPELIEEPCKGMWEGGPTPCECIKAIVQGLIEFKANKEPAKNQ